MKVFSKHLCNWRNLTDLRSGGDHLNSKKCWQRLLSFLFHLGFFLFLVKPICQSTLHFLKLPCKYLCMIESRTKNVMISWQTLSDLQPAFSHCSCCAGKHICWALTPHPTPRIQVWPRVPRGDNMRLSCVALRLVSSHGMQDMADTFLRGVHERLTPRSRESLIFWSIQWSFKQS